MVMEDGSERSAERMAKLLQSLNEACIITPEQMSQVRRLIACVDAKGHRPSSVVSVS